MRLEDANSLPVRKRTDDALMAVFGAWKIVGDEQRRAVHQSESPAPLHLRGEPTYAVR
jgi:hypothetical protein